MYDLPRDDDVTLVCERVNESVSQRVNKLATYGDPTHLRTQDVAEKNAKMHQTNLHALSERY